jgi:hypothetical protein
MKVIRKRELEMGEYYLVELPNFSPSGFDVCEFNYEKELVAQSNGDVVDSDTIYELPILNN